MTQPRTLTGTQSSHPLVSCVAERVSFLPISDIPPEAIPEESQSSNYWNGFTAMTFLQIALGEHMRTDEKQQHWPAVSLHVRGSDDRFRNRQAPEDLRKDPPVQERAMHWGISAAAIN